MKETPEQLKAKAKKLYDERQEKAKSWTWNGSADRLNFLARCRTLAKKIDVNATYPDPQAHAMMYLDSIATREGVDFTYLNENAPAWHSPRDKAV